MRMDNSKRAFLNGVRRAAVNDDFIATHVVARDHETMTVTAHDDNKVLFRIKIDNSGYITIDNDGDDREWISSFMGMIFDEIDVTCPND